jgi:hypothetical protein
MGTQSTILASGTTRATSSDVSLAQGASATVGIFVASGSVVPGMKAIVWIDTPGADNKEVELDHTKKQTVVNGPCTARVERVNPEAGFGVYQEI